MIENNFYIIDIFDLFSFAFLSINKDILKTWNIRFGHLRRQNILLLAKKRANNIDLTKPLLHNVCKLYSIDKLQAKLYYSKIKLGLKLLDLV